MSWSRSTDTRAVLSVRNLRHSQSERAVRFCEELVLNYTLQCWDRNTSDPLAQPGSKALQLIGITPVIVDDRIAVG